MSNEHYLREFLIDPKNNESLYFVLGLLELSIEEFTKCFFFFFKFIYYFKLGTISETASIYRLSCGCAFLIDDNKNS